MTANLADIGASVAFGFETPSTILARMRETNNAARSLDGDVARSQARQTFRDAWQAWYSRWQTFAAPYELDKDESVSMARLAMLTKSDEIATKENQFRNELSQLQVTYDAEKDAQGQPLPPRTGAAVLPGKETINKKAGTETETKGGLFGLLPWYVWLGVGVVGTGALVYLAWRLKETYLDVKAKEQALRHATPSILEAYGVPRQLGEAGVARHDAAPQVVVYGGQS
jgi:hypothetical protein